MGEFDPASLVDTSTPQHLLTDQKAPLELGQVPQELSQLIDDAYNNITQKLQTGGRVKVEEIPTRPDIYICKRNDLETMNKLSGSKPLPAHHFVGALYFAIPHAIFIPREDMEKSIASRQIGELSSTVYEEMIHALTTQYDEASQMLRTGFIKGKPVSVATAEKIKAGRKPKEKFYYYDWSIAFAGIPPVRVHSKDKGAVYREDETHTENATHLTKYLLFEDLATDIGVGQFIGDSINPKIKVLASAKCGQYKDEYKTRSNGRDISADLLSALYTGDETIMDEIADRYYRKPSSPLRAAALAVRFITKPIDRVAFQLRTVIQELKNPKSFVFSTPQAHI